MTASGHQLFDSFSMVMIRQVQEEQVQFFFFKFVYVC